MSRCACWAQATDVVVQLVFTAASSQSRNSSIMLSFTAFNSVIGAPKSKATESKGMTRRGNLEILFKTERETLLLWHNRWAAATSPNWSTRWNSRTTILANATRSLRDASRNSGARGKQCRTNCRDWKKASRRNACTPRKAAELSRSNSVALGK